MKKEVPTVAVVILNWNGLHWLQKFLPGVIAHSAQDGVEVVVADNNSSDDSLAWVQAEHPSVKCIQTGANLGYAGGYNYALQSLDADYFVLLNNDVEVREGWLQPLINRMESDSRIGACQPTLRWHAHPKKFEYAGAAGGYIDKWGFPFCRGRLFDNLEEDQGQYASQQIFWATGACLMVRASAWREVGGLDTDFFAHMEEIDLCWRLQHAGYSIWAETEAMVWHVGGGTLPQGNARKTYLNFRNNLFLLLKNLPRKRLLYTLFVRMVFDGIAAWRMFFSGDFQGFFAVGRAHAMVYLRGLYFARKRKGNEEEFLTLPGVYNGSVVWAYFKDQKRRFSLLKTS